MTQAFQIGPGQVGEKIILPIWAGGRESHNDPTPLNAGGFAFNPDDYGLAGTTLAFEFVCVAANGNTPLTTHIHLYNLTDAEIVTSSVINIVDSTNPTKYAPTLVVGAGAGEIKSGAEKLYECRIFLDGAPGDPLLDTIELFKAELRATHTIL
jgi:hypothetical protein